MAKKRGKRKHNYQKKKQKRKIKKQQKQQQQKQIRKKRIAKFPIYHSCKVKREFYPNQKQAILEALNYPPKAYATTMGISPRVLSYIPPKRKYRRWYEKIRSVKL